MDNGRAAREGPSERGYSPYFADKAVEVQENQVLISGHTVVEQESISRPRIHSHYLPPDPYDNPGGEEVRNEAQRWQRTCFRSHSL